MPATNKSSGRLTLFILFGCLILPFLLGSCSDFTAKMGVYADGSMEITYTLAVSLAELNPDEQSSVIGYLTSVAHHWQDLGMESSITGGTDFSVTQQVSLKASVSESCENGQAAFNALCGYLTNESFTLFKNVKYACESGYFKDEYYFEADYDFSNLIDYTELEKMPGDVKERILSAINGAKLTLVLVLPGEAVEDLPYVTEENGYCRGELVLGSDDTGSFKMHTEDLHEENRKQYEKNIDDIGTLGNLIKATGFTAAGLAVCGLLMLMSKLLKKKSNHIPSEGDL